MQTQYRRHLRNPRFWQIALAVYWLLLLVSTHLPQETPLLPKDGADKLLHVAAFAALAILSAVTVQRTTGRLRHRRLLYLWMALIVYAALDEWTQTFVGRYSSIKDWMADAIGAGLGLALFAWLRSKTAMLEDGPR
jgi:VanZ family protein